MASPNPIAAIALVLAMVVVTVAAAGQPLPQPQFPPPDVAVAPEPGTLADSIAREPQCRERTNGCELCVRTQAGRIGCSTPGIACQPQRWRCTPGEADAPATSIK